MFIFSPRILSRLSHYIVIIGCDSFSLFKVFTMSLTILRKTGQIFCRMTFNWELPVAFPMIRLGLCAFWEDDTEVRCHFHYIIPRAHVINIAYHCWCSLCSACLSNVCHILHYKDTVFLLLFCFFTFFIKESERK